MSCVDIRGCRIGEGRPKVILPIVERAEAAILEKPRSFQHCKPIVWNGAWTILKVPVPPVLLPAVWQRCGSS